MFSFILIFTLQFSTFAQSLWVNDAANEQWQETRDLSRYLFPDNTFPEHRGPRTDAALIITDNKVIYESYGRGYNKNKKHIGWSVSKTFLNAITGYYVNKGLLKTDDSVCKFIKPVNPEHCKIKIENLLNWTSGLEWRETYEKTKNPKTSSVMAMLYGIGRQDIGPFLTSHKLAHTPGTHWKYSSGDTNYLSYILMKVAKDNGFKEFFSALDIDSYVIEKGQKGVPMFSSHLYLSARNLAKFGELYLKNGTFKGQQILPENWISSTTQICPQFYDVPQDQSPGYTPGAHIWVNRTNEKVINGVAWTEAPDDTIAAQGHWGQMLFVIPSLKTIIVRYGDHREKTDFNTNTFLKHALTLVKRVRQ